MTVLVLQYHQFWEGTLSCTARASTLVGQSNLSGKALVERRTDIRKDCFIHGPDVTVTFDKLYTSLRYK